MMPDTQWTFRAEEVEAAAHAIVRCMFAPHELPLSDELMGKYRQCAQAALAAAMSHGMSFADESESR
jgi:hypothetical protein